MIQLYENIKARRMALGMTQDELAELIGYTNKAMISKVETGHVDLNWSKVGKFAQALHTTEAALLGWEFDPMDIVNKYESLDADDQKLVLNMIDTMLNADKYKKTTSGRVG